MECKLLAGTKFLDFGQISRNLSPGNLIPLRFSNFYKLPYAGTQVHYPCYPKLTLLEDLLCMKNATPNMVQLQFHNKK